MNNFPKREQHLVVLGFGPMKSKKNKIENHLQPIKLANRIHPNMNRHLTHAHANQKMTLSSSWFLVGNKDKKQRTENQDFVDTQT